MVLGNSLGYPLYNGLGLMSAVDSSGEPLSIENKVVLRRTNTSGTGYLAVRKGMNNIVSAVLSGDARQVSIDVSGLSEASVMVAYKTEDGIRAKVLTSPSSSRFVDVYDNRLYYSGENRYGIWFSEVAESSTLYGVESGSSYPHWPLWSRGWQSLWTFGKFLSSTYLPSDYGPWSANTFTGCSAGLLFEIEPVKGEWIASGRRTVTPPGTACAGVQMDPMLIDSYTLSANWGEPSAQLLKHGLNYPSGGHRARYFAYLPNYQGQLGGSGGEAGGSANRPIMPQKTLSGYIYAEAKYTATRTNFTETDDTPDRWNNVWTYVGDNGSLAYMAGTITSKSESSDIYSLSGQSSFGYNGSLPTSHSAYLYGPEIGVVAGCSSEKYSYNDAGFVVQKPKNSNCSATGSVPWHTDTDQSQTRHNIASLTHSWIMSGSLRR